MLEKPDLPDQDIIAGLRDGYALDAAQVTFLPIGADIHTAVYRVTAVGGTPYFLKLRNGPFDAITVEVPQLLKTQGSRAIAAATIAPLETKAGWLSSRLQVRASSPQPGASSGEPYQMILYPFVEGQDGYEAALTPRQWLDFGAALRGVHDMQLPPDLAERIRAETFSARYRDQARMYLHQAKTTRFPDPTAARLAAFMRARQDSSRTCSIAATSLAACCTRAPCKNPCYTDNAPAFVLCHADVHPGNLLLPPDSSLYLVDWDNPIFAPKERDLMSIGAGMGSDRGQGEALFIRATARRASTAWRWPTTAMSASSKISPPTANSCWRQPRAVRTASSRTGTFAAILPPAM